jgi:hypothetical protein
LLFLKHLDALLLASHLLLVRDHLHPITPFVHLDQLVSNLDASASQRHRNPTGCVVRLTCNRIDRCPCSGGLAHTCSALLRLVKLAVARISRCYDFLLTLRLDFLEIHQFSVVLPPLVSLVGKVLGRGSSEHVCFLGNEMRHVVV